MSRREEGKKKRGLLARSMLARIILQVTIIVFGSYLAIALLIYFKQDGMVFLSSWTKLSSADAAAIAERAMGEEITITTADGVRLHGFFFPGAGEGRHPVILYFGGNAETVGIDDAEWSEIRAGGISVALVAYRGFGRSQGTPSAKALLADSLVIHDAIAARPDVDSSSIIAWGRSLGSGIAAHVAANRPLRAVVLVAPYSRLSDTARHHYPWLPIGLLFRHEIDTMAIAPTMTVPVVIFHGDCDTIIPCSQSETLAAAWGNDTPKRDVTLHKVTGRDHETVTLDQLYPKGAYGKLPMRNQ